MSAIVGYAGQGGEAALRAMLAAADGTGITSAMQTASSAGLAVTGVNPVIFRDGSTLSAVAGTLARAGIKDCKTADVFDMHVTQPAHVVIEGEKTFKGVWNEIWTFRACGQMVDAYMTFIPDANGGGTTFTSGSVKP